MADTDRFDTMNDIFRSSLNAREIILKPRHFTVLGRLRMSASAERTDHDDGHKDGRSETRWNFPVENRAQHEDQH